MPKKLIIAGGSGSIGNHLIEHLKADYTEIVVLSRGKSTVHDAYHIVHWDAEQIGPWAAELEGAHAIINLTGKSIQCRFTEKNKNILWKSRVKSTEVIGRAIEQCQVAPKVWLNASGASIYPQNYEVANTESVTEVGNGFLAELSVAWEAAMHAHACAGTRKVIARITPVLDAQDGFLPPLLRLGRLGLGGRAGNGRQMISWIHHQDLCQAFSRLLSDEEQHGVFNIASPDARSNSDLMAAVRAQVKMPIGIPAPAFAIHMSSYVIGVDPSLILESSYVSPARLKAIGFEFDFPKLELALSNLV